LYKWYNIFIIDCSGINILLTILFLWPLWKAPVSNPAVRRVATRTLLASTIALITSAVNMLILTLMHGHQLGWVCLGSCGADTVVNAIALFWVTSGKHQSASSLNAPTSSGGRLSGREHSREPRPFKQPSVLLSAMPPSPGAGRALSPRRDDDAKELPYGLTPSFNEGDYAGVATTSPGARVVFGPTPTTPGTASTDGGEMGSPIALDPGWRVGRSQSRRGRGRVQRLVGLFHTPRGEREEHSLQVTVTREYVVEGELESRDDSDDTAKSGSPRDVGPVMAV
jgi:hypothetical protein